ncbi:ABC transporter substrate-binding protein [Paenibacillus sp. GCM10027628]|uniref:ABC transporter substrate-binding protein n=1 Tax=Paenibacillus sp. GCM10027628 TaxID=3273413 RepID=UPI003643AE6B
MSRKWKGFICLFVFVMILSTLLSACGGASDQQENDNGIAKDSAPYELSMAFITFGNLPDINLVQDEINKITKAKINATVKLTPVNISAWNQQINLMLAGSEKLDLIVSSSFFNYNSQVAKGQLLPLDDLIDKHGKGIKEVVEKEYLDGAKIGGKIYGVPSMRDIAADFGFVMRKDLVDKYHIDLSQIKTFSDLEPVFKTIRDNEPGVAPAVQQTQNQTIAEIMLGASFDTLGDSFGVLPGMDNGLKVTNMYESKEYADALALIRKWYQAGYILKDIATSQETGQNLVKSDKAFGYVANLKPGFEVQESRATGKEMVAVRLTKPVTMTGGITGFMMSISKNSGNPEKAMQFMNLMYADPAIVNLIDNGIEGKHYVKKSDQMIAMPDGVQETGYLFNQWELGNNFLAKVWEGDDPQIWEKMKAFNKSAIRSKALGFTFDAEPVKTEIAAVTNVVNQFNVGLGTGTLDPAANLPEFNAKLKSAGLDKIIAEKQKQLDAWAKARK